MKDSLALYLSVCVCVCVCVCISVCVCVCVSETKLRWAVRFTLEFTVRQIQLHWASIQINWKIEFE